MLRACPKFGNDDDRVDALAVAVAEAAFDEVRRGRAWRGGAPFQPACIMFVTYADAGLPVPATPDGRRAGEPVADSIGPMQGRDRHGPTAMLRSVSKLPLGKATGTPILNIRVSPALLKAREGRDKFKALARAYFGMGGLQLQATVVDQEVLRDAIAHPERHGDLIVRIGGYSEYFNNLSPALKRAVMERTEYG
jgi:formate C-acetyltransferase